MITAKKEPNFKLKERMLQVLKRAEFSELEELYHFDRVDFPFLDSKALNYIRNENYWTGFIEANDDTTNNYRVFCFKIKSTINNSGFIGWIATELKKELGISIIAFCTHNNSNEEDILYIGCSSFYGSQVKNNIQAMMN